MPVTAVDELDPDGEVWRVLRGDQAQDIIDFVELYLTIDNEYGQIVPVNLYPQQRLMYERATGRDITVKGRQTRASSALLMSRLRRLLFSLEGARCIIGAQDDPTVALFKTKIEHFVRDLNAKGFDIKLLANNKDEMVFGETENRIQFVSGEQRIIGRAFAAQEVHLSELAHWKPATADSLLGGLLPSVPPAPRGRVDFESTPAGEAGAFYKYAMAAKPLGENPDDEWTIQFYPWWLEPRYTVTDDPANIGLVLSPVRLADLTEHFVPTDEEKRLQDQGLNVNQILWRRLKKAEQDKTAAPFSQEYVEDVLKCWLGRTGRFFDTADNIDHLQFYRDVERPPIRYLRELSYKGDNISFFGDNLAIWENPIPGQAYVVCFDAAGGGIGTDYDYTSIGVWNASKEKRVARCLLQCTPSQAGAIVCAIGSYFGTALVGGERAHHGSGVFDKMRELGYPNIYYHIDPLHPLPANKTPEPGIYPSPVMRQRILETFRSGIVDHAIQSEDRILNQQMTMFTWEKARDRMKAQADKKSGAHDDVVMEAAQGWFLCSVARMRKMAQRRNEDTREVVRGRGGLMAERLDPATQRHAWLV